MSNISGVPNSEWAHFALPTEPSTPTSAPHLPLEPRAPSPQHLRGDNLQLSCAPGAMAALAQPSSPNKNLTITTGVSDQGPVAGWSDDTLWDRDLTAWMHVSPPELPNLLQPIHGAAGGAVLSSETGVGSSPPPFALFTDMMNQPTDNISGEILHGDSTGIGEQATALSVQQTEERRMHQKSVHVRLEELVQSKTLRPSHQRMAEAVQRLLRKQTTRKEEATKIGAGRTTMVHWIKEVECMIGTPLWALRRDVPNQLKLESVLKILSGETTEQEVGEELGVEPETIELWLQHVSVDIEQFRRIPPAAERSPSDRSRIERWKQYARGELTTTGSDKRRADVSVEDRADAVDRVSKRLSTLKEEGERFGVAKSTMARWVRERRLALLDEERATASPYPD